jgi:ABC-2 type transport system permease protein
MRARWSLLPASTPRSAFAKIALNELRLAWRQPIGLTFGLGLPFVLLVIFGSLPAFAKPEKSLGGLTYFEVYFPILIALVIAALGIISLPIPLATYREQGILRRLSTTPAPPTWVLAAQLLVNLGLAAMAMVLLVVVGIAGLGVTAPKNPGGFVLAIVLSINALFAIGLWIAAVARSTAAAAGIAQAWFYPLLFFAGLWVPRELMPAALRDVSDLTPLGASVQAMQSAMQGQFPSAASLGVLVAYMVILGLLAVRFFRWE